VVDAIAREWHDEVGWGVLDSSETPGGCWTHFSVIDTPLIRRTGNLRVSEFKSLSAGDLVDLEWEAPGQDGFAYRAVAVSRRR